MAVWSTRSAKWNSLTRSSMKVQLDSTTRGPMMPVRSTRATASPSTPTWYERPSSGSHSMRKSSWNSWALRGSKRDQAHTQASRLAIMPNSVTARICPFSPLGRKATSAATSSGEKMTRFKMRES